MNNSKNAEGHLGTIQYRNSVRNCQETPPRKNSKAYRTLKEAEAIEIFIKATLNSADAIAQLRILALWEYARGLEAFKSAPKHRQLVKEVTGAPTGEELPPANAPAWALLCRLNPMTGMHWRRGKRGRTTEHALQHCWPALLEVKKYRHWVEGLQEAVFKPDIFICYDPNIVSRELDLISKPARGGAHVAQLRAGLACIIVPKSEIVRLGSNAIADEIRANLRATFGDSFSTNSKKATDYVYAVRALIYLRILDRVSGKAAVDYARSWGMKKQSALEMRRTVEKKLRELFPFSRIQYSDTLKKGS